MQSMATLKRNVDATISSGLDATVNFAEFIDTRSVIFVTKMLWHDVKALLNKTPQPRTDAAAKFQNEKRMQTRRWRWHHNFQCPCIDLGLWPSNKRL